MDEEQRQARKAAIAEMMLALRVALETLDQLEARTAGEEKPGPASPDPESNPVARHIAAAMTKARSRADKA
jgi:hypothetical protein